MLVSERKQVFGERWREKMWRQYPRPWVFCADGTAYNQKINPGGFTYLMCDAADHDRWCLIDQYRWEKADHPTDFEGNVDYLSEWMTFEGAAVALRLHMQIAG